MTDTKRAAQQWLQDLNARNVPPSEDVPDTQYSDVGGAYRLFKGGLLKDLGAVSDLFDGVDPSPHEDTFWVRWGHYIDILTDRGTPYQYQGGNPESYQQFRDPYGGFPHDNEELFLAQLAWILSKSDVQSFSDFFASALAISLKSKFSIAVLAGDTP